MPTNPFDPDPVASLTSETLAELSRPALERMLKFLLNEQAALIRGLADEYGLVIARNDAGVLYFHLHQPDEQGECHTGQWAVEHGNIAATMLAGLRALIKGELPEQPPPAPADDAHNIRAA
jgi:hypothetical protein